MWNRRFTGADYPRKGLFCNRQKSSVDFNILKIGHDHNYMTPRDTEGKRRTFSLISRLLVAEATIGGSARVQFLMCRLNMLG